MLIMYDINTYIDFFNSFSYANFVCLQDYEELFIRIVTYFVYIVYCAINRLPAFLFMTGHKTMQLYQVFNLMG